MMVKSRDVFLGDKINVWGDYVKNIKNNEKNK
jgi:hypothetical protein